MAYLGHLREGEIIVTELGTSTVAVTSVKDDHILPHLGDVASEESAKLMAERWAERNPLNDYASGVYSRQGRSVAAVFRGESSKLNDIIAGRVNVRVVKRRAGGLNE